MKQLLDDAQFGVDGTGCGNCMRAYDIGEDDFVACGAAVEDHPIWAERKYSLAGMRIALDNARLENPQYIGQDDERLRIDDGGSRCRAYERRL